MSAIEQLSRTGELYPDDRQLTEIPGVTYTRDGAQYPVQIDRTVAEQCGALYADDIDMSVALYHLRLADVRTRQEAYLKLLEPLKAERQIWGFSGYATAGFDYGLEAGALRAIYEQMDGDYRPQMVVDGGVSAGVLGLNGLMAREHGLPSIGVIPRMGCGSLGVRDDMIIWGDTYRQREMVVGTLPHVLWCIGGADGTRREAAWASRQRSAIVIVALSDRTHGPKSLLATYRNIKALRSAERREELIICREISEIPDIARAAHAIGARSDPEKRRADLSQLMLQWKR